MSEGTSSKWFENQFEDEPHPQPPWTLNQILEEIGRQFGTQVITQQRHGKQAAASYGTHIHGLTLTHEQIVESLKPLGLNLASIAEKIKQQNTNYTEGKPPHSMAPSPKARNFDHRGRKQY